MIHYKHVADMISQNHQIRSPRSCSCGPDGLWPFMKHSLNMVAAGLDAHPTWWSAIL